MKRQIIRDTTALLALALVTAVLLGMFVAGLSGCAWLKSEGKHTATNAIDCTTQKATAAIKEFGPTVDQVVVNALDSAGKADWNAIKSATKDFAVDVGGCVLASTVVRLLGEAQSAGVLASSVPVDKQAFTAGWTELRRAKFGDATFQGVK